MSKIQRFYHHINLNERGVYYADIRDENDNTVFEIRSDEETGEIDLIADGFMSTYDDMDGLRQHLQELGILPSNAMLIWRG